MATSDPKPLPRYVQWWRRTADRRRKALVTLKSLATALVILAVSVVGATLISYGVYSVYPPAGFMTGGLMCWLLLWSHERDRKGSQ